MITDFGATFRQRYGYAIGFATAAHIKQKRKYTGEPFVWHPIRVAEMVEKHRADVVIVTGTILHDTIEDCGITADEIAHNFGARVAKLVEELTNPSKKFPQLKRAERKQMDFDHIQKASPSAKLVKLCDRIDNLSDMGQCPDEDFRRLYAQESERLLDACMGTNEVLEQMLFNVIHNTYTDLD